MTVVEGIFLRIGREPCGPAGVAVALCFFSSRPWGLRAGRVSLSDGGRMGRVGLLFVHIIFKHEPRVLIRAEVQIE